MYNSYRFFPSVSENSTDIVETIKGFYPFGLFWCYPWSVHSSFLSFFFLHFDEEEGSAFENNKEIRESRRDSHSLLFDCRNHGNLGRQSWLVRYVSESVAVEREPTSKSLSVLLFGHGSYVFLNFKKKTKRKKENMESVICWLAYSWGVPFLSYKIMNVVSLCIEVISLTI